MDALKKHGLTVIILACLTLGSLQFVNWICQMAFENTCIELEQQYITTEINEIIEGVEDSIDFGKELGNYYGMEDVIERVCNLSPNNLKVSVMDKDGKLQYLSFEESEENIKELAVLFSKEYQQKMFEVTEDGTEVAFHNKTSLVYPIYQKGDQLEGYMTVIYEAKDLINQTQAVHTQKTLFCILGVVVIVLLLFYGLRKKESAKKKMERFVSVGIVMSGMLAYILCLFFAYRESYNDLVTEKAKAAAVSIQGTIDKLVQKGLDVDQLYRIDNYLKEKEETIGAIETLNIVTDDSNNANNVQDAGALYLDIEKGQAKLHVQINQSYINEKINTMTLTFGAVFVVCLMIAFELTHLVEILAARISKEFNKKTKKQFEGVSSQIRMLSFLGYTAIYTSMPYASVIMRKWDAQVFGLSKAVSASLPLTVELVCVLITSAMVQRVYKNMKLNRFIVFVFPFLILGNLACMVVASPYMLIGLRAFCGIGFAFLKYWMNSIVTVGSEDEANFSINCGKLNAGLLGGITVGASLGAILAEALGYQSNYMFTAIILLVLLVWMVGTMPWKLLEQLHNSAQQVEKGEKTENLLSAFKNPKVLLTIVFGCVPLNIGLMYVVAFIPSYMESIGQSAIATSYVYLVNGLAGVYLGMLLLSLLKKTSLYTSAVLALFLAAGGMLVLLVNKSLGIIMISAGILGLFDGFGTPAITSYFTGLSKDKSETAGMLTVFNMVGSAVQIVCPTLYNMIIQPDGKTTYLSAFGVAYAVVAFLFMLVCRPSNKKKTKR